MTPEARFAQDMADEAKRRGLAYFLLVANPATDRFSYRYHAATASRKIVVVLEWLKGLFDEAGCQPGPGSSP